MQKTSEKVSQIKIIGIAAEYDPFTNGHAEHIRRTRSVLGEDCAVVCVMSGSFTQRGEPACLGKFARARAAVEGGADLVLELPTDFALASAERFAFGAASVLDALGCVDAMSFGSESGDAEELAEIAGVLLDPEIDALIRAELALGAPYAAARQRAAEKLSGRKLPARGRPNDILAIEYIKALRRLGSGVEPVAILREGAHDADGPRFPSASVLRAALRRGGRVDGMTPPACADLIRAEIEAGRAPVSSEALETAVLARLRSMKQEDFIALPDSGDGLAERMLKAVSRARTLAELYELTKTRRLAMSRIRRAAMCAFLGVTAESRAASPLYIRVLAAGEKGRAVLKKKTRRLPLVTKAASAKKLDEAALSEFMLDVRASDLRSLGRPSPEQRIPGEDWLTSPYMA